MKELEKQIEESEKELLRAVNVNRVLSLILRNQIAIMKQIKLKTTTTITENISWPMEIPAWNPS